MRCAGLTDTVEFRAPVRWASPPVWLAGAQRIFDAHVVVVGIGGVGSWTAEALARSGVRRLTLIDLDHVSESNFNRQIHANNLTLGQKQRRGDARAHCAVFHPDCVVDVVDDFVTPENWPDCCSVLETKGGARVQ